MMPLTPAELRQHLGRGALLSFPVTPFAADGAVDVAALRDHLAYLLTQGPDGLFVCGGTGEFPSLAPEEWRTAIAAAVAEVRGRVPVIAGGGGGVALARAYVREAAELGCDGVLVLPPYLTVADQDGLYAHYAALAREARLGLIVYQRDNAVFAPETVARLDGPALAGFKDGLGDVERLTRIALATEGGLPLCNGLPTAEMSQMALGAAGATSYSSAVFNFVPELALRFYRAWRGGDQAAVRTLLTSFYAPLCALREKRRGYAVSLIKVGLELCGRPCGPVRPPLPAVAPEHRAALAALLEANGIPVRG